MVLVIFATGSVNSLQQPRDWQPLRWCSLLESTEHFHDINKGMTAEGGKSSNRKGANRNGIFLQSEEKMYYFNNFSTYFNYKIAYTQ